MLALPFRHRLTAAALAAGLGLVQLALAAQPDFGDNSSRWADDGECDDPRFSGEGAAATLLEEDRGHDAADCRTLFEAGRIALRTETKNVLHWRGRLESGDDTLTSGELFDSYEFEGSPGEYVAIDLRSAEFDTYLILEDPAGEQTENDDAEDDDDVGHSRIETRLTEGGTYHVFVTSYESDESGAYALTIDGALER